MRKTIFTCFLMGITCLSVCASHTGHVFVDNNNNGVFDKGEAPLKGVAVSDGFNVVLTASDGSYILAGHTKERFIFITTPSGYRSDNKHYRKIERQNSTFDFGLQSYGEAIKKDGSHKFVHIADTEIFSTENHDGWVNNVRDYTANEGAAFIIHTGDICYENGLESHIRLMNTANMNCPMFYCIGNHDLVKGEYGEHLFENLYGPVFYSFEVGNVHYIVTPMLGGDHAPSYKKEDVYRWMKNDLSHVSKDKAIMVFNHDLLTYDNEFIYGINDTEYINLNEHNLKAWIYGHWHINYMKKQGDVYSISTAALDKGGIDHSTSAFRVMHIDGKGDFGSELRYSYIDKSVCIASPAEGRVPVLNSGFVPLSVNTYSSVSPVKEVVYSLLVDGKVIGGETKLRQQTNWNWYAELPLTSKDYGHRIIVRVLAKYCNNEAAVTESSFIYKPGNKQDVKVGDNWSNLLGNPQHTGVTSSVIKTPLHMSWVSNVEANIYMSSPLVYQGNVYVASVDENLKGEAAIFALDGLTGKLLWRYQVRNSIKNTIAAADGCIFAQDAQGYLYAINVSDGTLRWEKQLSVNGLPALIEGLVASDRIVYAGTGKGLCASDTQTGKVIWTNKDWGQGEGTTSTLALNNDVLIGSAQWSALFGTDATTGKMLWRASENGLRNRGASAALHDDLLYITSASSIFIMDARTGKVIIRKELPYNVDVTSTPLLTDKEIIFGTADSGMVAVDNETLEVKWNFMTGDALVYTSPYSRKSSATIETSPVISGNTIFVGASDGTIYGIDKEKGNAVWKHNAGAPIFGSVAVSGNTLFAVDFAGNVYAFVSSDM